MFGTPSRVTPPEVLFSSRLQSMRVSRLVTRSAIGRVELQKGSSLPGDEEQFVLAKAPATMQLAQAGDAPLLRSWPVLGTGSHCRAGSFGAHRERVSVPDAESGGVLEQRA